METKNYYSILGLDRKATDAEIKNTYHKLVKLYHPDLKMGDNKYLEKFIQINEAYSVLKNEISRCAYDLELRQKEINEEQQVVNNSAQKTNVIIKNKKVGVEDYLNYYKSAKKAYSKGEYVKALNDVKKSLEINKTFAKAYVLKGDILFKYQNYKDALVAYETYTKYCDTKELNIVKSKIEACVKKKNSEKNVFSRIKRKLFK